MFMDKNLMFWDDNTTIDGTPSDALALRETGLTDEERKGEPLEIIILCSVALAGTFNIDINLVTATNANLTTNQQIQKIIADNITAMAAGQKFRVALDLPVADADATHIGLDVIVNSGSVTAGTLSAWIQRVGEDQDAW